MYRYTPLTVKHHTSGIRPGDALLSIENQDVVGYPLSSVCQLLSDLNSDRVTLTVANYSGAAGVVSNSRQILIILGRRGGLPSPTLETLLQSPSSPKTPPTTLPPGKMTSIPENTSEEDVSDLSPSRAAALNSRRVAAAVSGRGGGDEGNFFWGGAMGSDKDGSVDHDSFGSVRSPQSIDLKPPSLRSYKEVDWTSAGSSLEGGGARGFLNGEYTGAANVLAEGATSARGASAISQGWNEKQVAMM